MDVMQYPHDSNLTINVLVQVLTEIAKVSTSCIQGACSEGYNIFGILMSGDLFIHLLYYWATLCTDTVFSGLFDTVNFS